MGYEPIYKQRCGAKPELGLLFSLKLRVPGVWFVLGVISPFNWELDCWPDSSKSSYWTRIETTTPIWLGVGLFPIEWKHLAES
jgi:hypothetical protein